MSGFFKAITVIPDTYAKLDDGTAEGVSPSLVFTFAAFRDVRDGGRPSEIWKAARHHAAEPFALCKARKPAAERESDWLGFHTCPQEVLGEQHGTDSWARLVVHGDVETQSRTI